MYKLMLKKIKKYGNYYILKCIYILIDHSTGPEKKNKAKNGHK